MKKWLDKYEAPKAQNGIEGTMGGLTDKGFNYNGAWGGTMAMGGSLPGSVGFTYARTGDIPSNGPYAKKTKASAQDGTNVKKPSVKLSPDELKMELVQAVRKSIGPIATPDEIVFVEKLPKTRSGKIMRRVLKAQELGLPVGDTSTLEN